jgi:hypothetical protein
MGNRNDLRVVLGSLRYKSAPNTNLFFQVPLKQTQKENIEFDRSIDVDLEQVFLNERQNSDTFRPTGKFSILFKNSYSGFTNYPPFENNLYYLNSEAAAVAACGAANPSAISWTGLPQYNEFDFIRKDYNVVGYTQPPNEHLIFSPKSASSYNWNFFVSYPCENDYTKQLQAIDKQTNITLNWVVGDGIPFIIEKVDNGGLGYISFRCPVKHGLSVGDFVKLSLSYNGTDKFQVSSLGSNAYGSEEYVFNIIDVGFTSVFINNVTGTAKRVILTDNESDTISEYYVRKHRLLTNSDNAVLVNSGFEQSIFGESKKYESSGFTPNQTARVSIKEGSQSYTLSFNKDIHINPLIDNQKRPITELFLTVIWKGYFGWTFGIPDGLGGFNGLKEGWEFNLPLNSSNQPNSWWSNSNSNSNTNFNVGVYNTPQGVAPNVSPSFGGFTYIESLNEDDILDGDVCEWNNYEQKERIVSKIYHKFKFNPFVFSIGGNVSNPFGYYYQPHHSIKIRVFSDYIEEGDPQNVVGIPDYAYFSTTKNLFIWRDLYPYGYIDSSFNGVDYPFLNGVHYPYGGFIFRIIPEGTNYSEQTIIADPLTDDCE